MLYAVSPEAKMEVSVASLASIIAASMSTKEVLDAEEEDELEVEKEKEIQAATKDRLLTREGRMRYQKALRNKLPVLSFRDIRRFRMPFHEALCEELMEDGFQQTASYLESLVKLDDEIRNLAGPESLEWLRPRLLDQMDFLLKLRVALIEAEIAQRKGECNSSLVCLILTYMCKESLLCKLGKVLVSIWLVLTSSFNPRLMYVKFSTHCRTIWSRDLV